MLRLRRRGLEIAQQVAAHESQRTTGLYDTGVMTIQIWRRWRGLEFA